MVKRHGVFVVRRKFLLPYLSDSGVGASRLEQTDERFNSERF